jgi:hypothetical protein
VVITLGELRVPKKIRKIYNMLISL